MKITRMPNNSQAAAPERVVIVREESNGCLLAFVIFVCIVVALLLVFFGVPFMIAHSSRRQDLESPGNSATAVTPDARKQTYLFKVERDKIDDRIKIFAVWRTRESEEAFSFKNENIVFRFWPTEISRKNRTIKYDVECYFYADFTLVDDDAAEVVVRFDDRPAQTYKCSQATSQTGYFIEDPRKLLAEMANAERMVIRFKKFNKEKRDLEFNLGGFDLPNLHGRIFDAVANANPTPPNVKFID